MTSFRKLFNRALYNVKKSLEAEVYSKPLDIATFNEKALKNWRVSTDSAYGGKTTANLTMSEDGKAAVFHGRYSKDMDDSAVLIRSGFCGINLKLPKALNIHPYDFFDLRLRGDGKTYVANVRLDHLADGDEDVWQALIKTKPGQWQDCRIEARDLVLTFKGRAVDPVPFYSVPMRKISSFGVSFSASEGMPEEDEFRLEVESVRAGAYRLRGSAASAKLFEGFITSQNDMTADFPRVTPPPISSPDDPRPA